MGGDSSGYDEVADTGRPLHRDANFMVFWAGQALSQFGAQLGLLAMPVLAVALLHASEWEVGVLNAANTAAFLAVGLPVGAWVDRWCKRPVMIRADLARALLLAVIPLAWYLGVLEVWHLWVVALLLGVATVFFDVSYQSYIPWIVHRGRISEANARLETTGQVSRLAGPAAAGTLLGIVAAPVLFIGQAVGYVLSALCLWRVRDREEPADARPPDLRAEIAEGLGYVLRHPLIGRIAAATAITNFFSTILFTLAPILVLRTLGLDPVQLGLVYSIGAAGGLLAAAITPWVAARLGEGTSLPVATLVTSVGMAGFPLSVLVPGAWAFPLLAASMFVLTMGVLVYNIIQVSMRQKICPPRLLGRMNASIRFLVWGVLPVAALLAGVLGEAWGPVAAMWVGVAGSALAAVPLLLSPIARMRTLPDAPEDDAA
ncbi:MFS transporter [Zafaria sp. Z1313]|uniref:MFS transporter n=1 Tax=unclassified Zafaria TaxID=2828765 RepID=UPI002E7686B8|nr:MFS transporter [Zafaria sp. J156]MEE1620408.1 MFS transporter [Zafaria sp. J156]